MKVLHITTEYGSIIRGGLGRFVTALIAEQSKKISTFVARIDGYVAELYELYNDEIVIVAKIESKRLQFLDYDIIHFHDWHGAALLEFIDNEIPLVATIHLPASLGAYHMDNRIAVMAERALASSANKLVANSKFTERILRHRYGGVAPSICTIYNGIELSKYQQPVPIQRSSSKIAFVGRLAEQKGVDIAISAMKHINQMGVSAPLLIAGDGPDLEKLQSQVVALNLENGVEFKGWLNELSVISLLETVTMLVVPSRFEPFGLIAAEAMALGCPVIASRTGGLQEIIENGHSGLLVPANDPKRLARAIFQLLSCDESRRLLSNRAQIEVRNNFGIEKCARQYNKLYSQLL